MKTGNPKIDSITIAVILTAFILITSSCTKNLNQDNNLALKKHEEEKSLKNLINPDSLNISDSSKIKTTQNSNVASSENSNPYPEIKYKRIKIRDKGHLDSIKKTFFRNKEFTPAYNAVSTLNRKEYRFYRVNDSILLPDNIIDDQKAYSVLPHYYPEVANFKKFIVVSINYQCYGAYENGKLVHFAAINSGKHAGSNPQGLYYLTWKAKSHVSSYDETWIMPFTFNYTRIGQAFHQYLMPGYPASHGCLRQLRRDAEWLFSWGDTRKIDPKSMKWGLRSGTPVIIIDQYDYEKKYKPWRYLKSNRDTLLELPKEPMAIQERF
jgi:hypothetical protein